MSDVKWKLVPVEPTDEMLEAGRHAPMPLVYLDSLRAEARLHLKTRYRAMLAAAPSPAALPSQTSGAEAGGGPFWDSPPGRWDDGDFREEPYPEALAKPASWVANCCNCGRIIDTREKADGGDDWGHQLSDKRWVCSPECLDAIVEPASEPAGGGVREALAKIADEARKANDVIRLNRDGGGQGRVKVATAMHRIAKWADAALSSPASSSPAEAEALPAGVAHISNAMTLIDKARVSLWACYGHLASKEIDQINAAYDELAALPASAPAQEERS